jgi:hypothetical protein
MRPLGIVLLLIALAYVAMAAFHNGSVNIRFHLRRLNVDWTLPVPPLKLTAYQIVVASADLLVAAWVLYLLMPSMGIDYLKFVGIYMVAYVLVVISHVPGGFGVLEPGILLMLPEQHRLAGFAALVVFRIIYYWAPLVIALTLLSVYEIAIHRRSPASLNAPAPSEVSALQPSQKS